MLGFWSLAAIVPPLRVDGRECCGECKHVRRRLLYHHFTILNSWHPRRSAFFFGLSSQQH